MKVCVYNVSAAMADFFQELLLPVPGGGLLRRGGVTAALTGLPWASHNLVWLERSDAGVAAVTEVLDEVDARGFPFVLEARPGNDELAKLAASRGMTPDEQTLLMVADSAADVRPPDGLSIRLLDPHEVSVHAQLAAEAFEAPAEVFRGSVVEDALRNGAVRCYVGELGATPVTTGLSITTGGFTGIIDIATDSRHRGRGFGSAITARAVADGLAAGASWCWLQSSPDGFPLYESLGFRTLESWQAWLSASSGPA